MPDKFSATWVSYSSISDYLQCPRAYYLKNIYKDSQTGHKITIANPSLTLGQAVHNILEALSVLPVEQRNLESLVLNFQKNWHNVTGEKGGFSGSSQEAKYKERGEDMLRKVMDNPGPLKRKAIKVQKDLLTFWLSEEDEIILCGKIDWLEYLQEQDAVHIIDFKTGQKRERNSLQLPIYYLLAKNNQKREVTQISYWYLALDDNLTSAPLPDYNESLSNVLQIAKKIKLARSLKKYDCPKDGCRSCQPFERVIAGEGKIVGVDGYNKDLYFLPQKGEDEAEEEIL